MPEGAVATSPKLVTADGSAGLSWWKEVWLGCRPATIAIAIDVVIYCCCLIGLMIFYLAVKVFHQAGYPEQRLAFFELAHFWAYWVLNLLFVWDLVFKSVLLLASGWKIAKRTL
jgi:hypothetical protein